MTLIDRSKATDQNAVTAGEDSQEKQRDDAVVKEAVMGSNSAQ